MKPKKVGVSLLTLGLCGSLTVYYTDMIVTNLVTKGGLRGFLEWLLTLKTARYYAKRTLPVVLLFFALVYAPVIVYDVIYYAITYLALPLLFLAILSGNILRNYGLEWQYAPAIQWLGAASIIYNRLKPMGKPTAMNISIDTVYAGGWLHEIYLYHPRKLFIHSSHVLGVHTQLLALVFLLGFMVYHRWRPTRWFKDSLAFWVFYIVVVTPWLVKVPPRFAWFDIRHRNVVKFLVQWAWRLPTVNLALATIGGFQTD